MLFDDRDARQDDAVYRAAARGQGKLGVRGHVCDRGRDSVAERAEREQAELGVPQQRDGQQERNARRPRTVKCHWRCPYHYLR